MMPRPGSFLWLAAHDLRQSWRGFEAAIGGFTPIKTGLLIGLLVALHALYWLGPAYVGLDRQMADDSWLSSHFALGLLFVLPGIVAQAMTTTTRALYARGDLELLFASPVSARAVFGARSLSTAVNAVAWFAILLLPLANVNALAGRLHWLAFYPALAACGLFGTAIGIVLALSFFRAVGPRRARLVSQIAATAIGACFMLGLQGYAATPTSARASLMAAMEATAVPGWLDWRTWLSLPTRAASGNLPALGLWLAVALAVFSAVTLCFGERFARAAVASAGAPSAARRPGKSRTFRTDLGATMRSKERRLILRDPWLISQIVLQVVYMLPISLILWRNGGVTSSPGMIFTPLIVVIGAQLAGSLAWLALSGEDAPDLLRAAPVTSRQIQRHKIQAILGPVAILLCAPIAALALASPWSALCAAFFALGASVSTALLNLWRQSPSPRSRVLQRHSQSKLVGLIEHVLAIVWAVGAVIAVMGSWSALVLIAVAAFILWASRPRARRFNLPASA
jgi:ABC-2 type transport system permease protein